MTQDTAPGRARSVPTVDISSFNTRSVHLSSEPQRQEAGKALVDALHNFEFVKVTGHGVSKDGIQNFLDWSKKLFDLPYDDKMKAPHPPGPIPHRGYSGIGKEKVYSQADAEASSNDGDVEKNLRKIMDYKESFEIGSENDPVQQNIWLPEDVLPNFRESMKEIYDLLSRVSRSIIDAIAEGLDLNNEEHGALQSLISDRHCQLRLLHYPPISKDMLEKRLLARLPAHNDWGTFTLLFQDARGGLELRDPKTQEYLHAEPEEGALVLNVGDMLQRFTNDYFVSALHRVSIPSLDSVPEAGLPARYSVPFFTGPDFASTVATLPRFIKDGNKGKYEPVRFDEYGSIVSKYQYEGYVQ